MRESLKSKYKKWEKEFKEIRKEIRQNEHCSWEEAGARAEEEMCYRVQGYFNKWGRDKCLKWEQLIDYIKHELYSMELTVKVLKDCDSEPYNLPYFEVRIFKKNNSIQWFNASKCKHDEILTCLFNLQNNGEIIKECFSRTTHSIDGSYVTWQGVEIYLR